MIDINKFGQWGKIESFLSEGLVYGITNTYHIVANSQARAIQRRLQKAIKGQSYSHKPLNEKYRQWKVAKGFDSRILIKTGQYLNGIEVWYDGDKQWNVGFKDGNKNTDGLELGQLGKWLEYGTSRSPARPHWRVEYAKMKGSIKSQVSAQLKDIDMEG